MPVPERERDMDIYAAEQRARRELLEEIARWLRHVDRMDEIRTARIGMPWHNVLWDAANAIEARFGHGGK